jgi:hypothetical protein
MRPIHGALPSSPFHGLAFAPKFVTLSHEFCLRHRRSPSLQSRAFNGEL